MMIQKIFSSRFWLPLLLVLLIAVNWLAANFHTRIDLTNEKRFTLSPSTKALLKKTDEAVEIYIFLKGALPSGFRQLASSSEDILREFKETAGSKIRYRFVDPDQTMPGTEIKYADTLAALGMLPINLTSQLKEGQQQQFVYPFALIHYKDRILPVELYKGKSPIVSFSDLNSSVALLEYRFANAINRVRQTENPAIGYLRGNGQPEDVRTYDLVENVLRQDYKLFTFDLSGPQFIPHELKAVLIVKPTKGFTDLEKLKLDQYVMNGGRLLMFIDRLEAEMDSLQIKNQVTAFDRNLELNDLLFNYGARINPDLLMDLQCDYLPFDVNGNGQFDLLPWNYFPVFDSKNNHPINRGLGFVSGRFVNSIDTIEAEGITKTVLLSSSANSRTLGSPAVISGAENINAPEDAKYKKANVPAAVLLEGKFRSLYANRLSQAMRDSVRASGSAFLPQCTADNKIILAGDGDMILNSVVKSAPVPMGMNPFTYGSQRAFPFANKDFLQNCLEYLVNDAGLAEAKAKDYPVRLLDSKKVDEQKTFWQLINIILPVAVVLLFAVVFAYLRKRKYTKPHG